MSSEAGAGARPGSAPAGARRRRWTVLRRPPAHWFLLGVAVVVLLLMLSTASVLHVEAGSAPLGKPALAAPDVTGPVLDLSGVRLRSGHGDESSIGLAIVGLPDPEAVALIIEALEARDASATWFVSGADVVDRGRLVRRILRAGGEIGVTGYTGRDLRTLPAWRLRLELSVTQAVLAARFDVLSPLLLVPAAPTRDVLDARSLRAARTAAGGGYLLVAGASAATAEPGDVAVVVASGRSIGAVAELHRLLDRAGREGPGAPPVRSVGEAVGLDPEAVNPSPQGSARANGWLVVGAVTASTAVAGALRFLFVPVTLLVTVRAALTVVFGIAHARRKERGDRWTGPVSVIVPAYNEAVGIEATVRSIAACSWGPGLEIVVVDDGSTDGTAEIAESLDIDGLRVVRQANAGKPAALNAGVAASSADIVVLVDGDTLFQPDTITRLVAPFATESIGAVSGNAKVANRSSTLGRWQHIEYVMGFNLDRRFLDTMNAIATIPGAIGAFRRQALVDVGGVSDDTIAEDTDLTIAINRAGWRVAYEPRAIAWTEAPSSAGDLWRQRYRWSYGVLQAVWKHRRAVLEGRSIGTVGLPYALVFQVLVGLVAPIVDVAALHSLAIGSYGIVYAWAGFTLLQVGLAAFAFRLDGESWRPLWAVPLQQVFYRQLMYLVVIQAIASAAAGVRLRWHKLHRVGISPAADSAG